MTARSLVPSRIAAICRSPASCLTLASMMDGFDGTRSIPIVCERSSRAPRPAPMARILIPLPSDDFDPTESGVPWRGLNARGHRIVFATPDGRAR